MGCFLAVDGGGTKTFFALYNMDTGVIATSFFGATNPELLVGGFEEMRKRLHEMTGKILEKNNLSSADIQYSVWGMSGLDTKSQYEIIHGFIREMGFERFTLCNDCDLGIKAALPGGYGICLVNGTGVNTVGINEQGQRYQIGALFELTGDYGGGMVLGQLAIQTAYMNLFRYRRETILTNMVMNLYEVDSRHDFTDRVMDWRDSKKIAIPHVAKCIFDAANLGDEQAIAILERMSDEYALCVKSLTQELPFADDVLNIVLVGSLFTKGWSSIPLHALEEKLKLYIPEKEFILHILKRPPVVGALAWALEEGGVAEPWEKACKCFA
ncbi:MAG: hypothetical protein FWG94_00285 [Oscillospiraceae bacterium]|nr:hypothetical protein [Oscillospiraceae bacterium]